jgi:hypothetical protein
MAWEYRVVPFSVQIKAGENRVQAAAAQFQNMLVANTGDGFEYYRMDHYSLFEQPGCLTALLGAKASVITYDVAVFRRQC